MANETVIAQVRSGMTVHIADGQPLGNVTQVWVGTDPTASCPRCLTSGVAPLTFPMRGLIVEIVTQHNPRTLLGTVPDKLDLGLTDGIY